MDSPDLDISDWEAPDTIPPDFYGDTSQDEVSPQSEADTAPQTPKRSWQDKIKGERDQPKKPKVTPPKQRPGALVKPLTDLYVTIGTMLAPFDQPCGMVIVNCAPDCAKALDSLARENDAVRRALMSLLQTSVYGQLIAAHLPILMAIAMHHVGPVRQAMQGTPIVTMPQPRPEAPNGQ